MVEQYSNIVPVPSEYTLHWKKVFPSVLMIIVITSMLKVGKSPVPIDGYHQNNLWRFYTEPPIRLGFHAETTHKI